jgi:hypothetical protein
MQGTSAFTAIGIHQHRKIITGIFKKKCLAASGSLADTIGNFCHFEVRVNKSTDTNQFTFLFQYLNKMLLIFIRHGLQK